MKFVIEKFLDPESVYFDCGQETTKTVFTLYNTENRKVLIDDFSLYKVVTTTGECRKPGNFYLILNPIEEFEVDTEEEAILYFKLKVAQ